MNTNKVLGWIARVDATGLAEYIPILSNPDGPPPEDDDLADDELLRLMAAVNAGREAPARAPAANDNIAG